MEESVEVCPQCNIKLDKPSCRLVQDTCGHTKCRLCLLNDEIKCKKCLENDKAKDEPLICHTAVITYQNKGCDTNTNSNVNEELIGDDLQDKKTLNKLTPAHITVNEDSTKFTCNLCGKSFTTRSHIKYHFYCGGAKKPFQCDICQKEFIVKYHLQTHLLVHKDEKPYSCDKCNKSFIARSKLNRHKFVHSEIRSFVCPECGKSFKNKENLRTHTYIHQPEKALTCVECKAKFNNSSNYKKHVQCHNIEKAHMCDLCGKRFKLKWALSLHKKSHSTLRDNHCAKCSKSFVHLKDLHRHELIHLDTKGYTCGICQTSFKRKDNLHRHAKNTHPNKKAIVIKNTIKKPVVKAIVDHPNAINVITASPSFNNYNKLVDKPKSESCTVSVINAPLKLAFKTSAFKNSYNIQRNYVEPTVNSDQVSVYEKILLENGPTKELINPNPPPTISTNDAIDSHVICQKTSPLNASPHYETSFDNKKHAITFKFPAEYTNLKAMDNANDPTILDLSKPSNRSVIVRSSNVSQQEMHWRRRTAQNLSKT